VAGSNGPVEHVADLKCPQGHTVEVHWTEGQQADHWQCPACLDQFHAEESAAALEGEVVDVRSALRAAHAKAHRASLVKFGNRKRGDRELPHDLSARR
jgi:hypothetical protein